MRTRLCGLGLLLTLGCGLLKAQTPGAYAITTFAGGFLGDNGPAASAVLWSPEKVITDAAGNVYIADTESHRVRRVSPSGVITTVAGSGSAGFSGDEGPATAAQLRSPYGLALADGSLYIADSGNNRVRRVTLSSGTITTVAGGGVATQLSNPRGIVFDASGNLYIADANSGRLLRLAPNGQARALLSGLSSPGGLAVDAAGDILVADTGHHAVVRVRPTGEPTIVAGTGGAGSAGDGGPATAGFLFSPSDVAVSQAGAIYIADTGNNRIRKVFRQGNEDWITSEVAGLSGPRGVWVDAGGALYMADTGASVVGKLDAGRLSTVVGGSRSRGDGGPATSASLNSPRNVILDANGNVLIADTSNHKVRRVSPEGTINLVAGTGIAGVAGDGTQALAARLSSPVGLAADAARNVYIGDTGNARLRQVRPAGDIITVVGLSGWGDWGDGGGASSAQVKDIQAVAVDEATGDIYIADTGNHRIRRIRKDNGNIERFAGASAAGAGADGVAAILSAMNSPRGVAIGKNGTVYFSDTGNHRVRRVLPSGIVETVAGAGVSGFAGDNGAATAARLNAPAGLALDADGGLYIADTGNHRIRHVTAGGFIRTIAGTGEAGFSGDDGAALSAQLNTPTAVAVDSRGNIYIADSRNHRVRRLSPDVSAGRLVITAGNNQSGAPGARLPIPLTVRLTNLNGAPAPGVTISFVVTRGLATLSASSAVTNADGVASVTITLGGAAGEVAVVATAPGVLPVQFQLTAEGALITGQPRILAGGVVGAGLSVPKVRHLAPNGLYTVFGENFAQAGGGWQVGPGDLVGGQVPVRFRGVCVEVDGTAAPVIQVYPGQISFQAPRLSTFGVKPVRVVLNCREAGEVRSDIEYVEMRATSPEFFFFVQNADGRNPVAAVNALTGVYVGPAGLIPGVTFAPLKPGDYVTIFGSGFGATNPLVFTGDLAAGAATVSAAVAITLGGRPLADSDLLYVGVTPGFAGLYQINFRIPADAPDGDLPLAVSIGGVPSPEGAYLTVRRQP
jgi:uncharacterized protein (TIGR03437 family)